MANVIMRLDTIGRCGLAPGMQDADALSETGGTPTYLGASGRERVMADFVSGTQFNWVCDELVSQRADLEHALAVCTELAEERDAALALVREAFEPISTVMSRTHQGWLERASVLLGEA